MPVIIKVEVRPGYVLSVTFEDGTAGEVSMKERLFGPVFEPLKNPELFAQVTIDEFGALCWPNGADLAPDALYRKLDGDNSAHANRSAAGR